MKSREALARDEFIQNNPDLFNPETLGNDAASYYLKNRIERAFLAGIDAGKRIAIDAAVANFEDILWNCQDG
jgi:hypothetical protein